METNFLKEGAKMKDLSLLEASEREAVIARRAYQKQWRAANKEKVIAIQSRFRLKKARELQEGGEKNEEK